LQELKDKLDEAEKETRMAQVLQKTYVDQLERERNKLLDEERQRNELNSIDEGAEKAFLIRNNEGKICNKRKGSKS
jgi:hypothetical protein